MELQLKPKHLVPYVLYGIKVQVMRRDGSFEIVTLTSSQLYLFEQEYYFEFKPILKRLDLYKLIFDKFNENIDDEFMGWFNDEFIDLDEVDNVELNILPYGAIEWLLKNHYDIFNLIPQGLAIDVNSLSLKK